MPAPRRTITPEDRAARKVFCHEAITLGAIATARKLDYPQGTRFELVCFGPHGCVHPETFQPITVEAWIADCRRRGVVPTVLSMEG